MIDTNPKPNERTVEDIAATINGGTKHMLLGTFDTSKLAPDQLMRASARRAGENLVMMGLWDEKSNETDRGRQVRELLTAASIK